MKKFLSKKFYYNNSEANKCKTLSILFVPISAVGHVNAAIGIAEVLIQSGHKVIFAINHKWKGRLTKYGIEEVLITEKNTDISEENIRYYKEMVLKEVVFKPLSPLEKLIHLGTQGFLNAIEVTKKLDVMFEQLLDSIRPDVIIVDQLQCIPAILKSGIPWVFTCSSNPLFFIDDERTPPPCSGLPSVGPKCEWTNFRNSLNNSMCERWNKFNEFVISSGLQPLEYCKFYKTSPYLNIYGYPLELDYLDMRPLPPNWCRFDYLKKTERELVFEIPEKLRQKFGKLILFDIYCMCGTDVDLINRLINIMSKSKNRFIVSFGPIAGHYVLADNMWGQQSESQLQVLPFVDLVITFGGNNTLTEAFYFGKPMIVMPLFVDQFDNAQRVHENGLGLRLDPFNCTEKELLYGIESVLNNKLLNEKLQQISRRIQTENSLSKLPKLIENLVLKT